MPKKSKGKAKRPPRPAPITKAYGKFLEAKMGQVARERGRTLEELAEEAGMGKTTLYRVLGAKPSVSLVKVGEVLGLIESLTGASLPPPIVPVENQEHYELIELGRKLLSEDPSYFRALVEGVKARLISTSLVKDTTSLLGVTPKDE